ncbi:hypothetical protein KVF89_14720 [Nocardioides carbamazepini]|uniref:NAD(P)-binding domain-containing protein n=1 Tax=Nocardioides carbamazepini TaxID=2854259 RepID=UPI00214A22CB|nr:NAD(P)-binding domain-containing protein [Nocardioides carbamazepini]MCR1783791.1 hypothetical protein [Nocardioides carbamazepini]
MLRESVCVVGLGGIGHAMASRLDERGWTVVGVEPDDGRRTAWLESGARTAHRDLGSVDWSGIGHLVVAVRTEEQVTQVLAACAAAPTSLRILLVSTVRPSFWRRPLPAPLELGRVVECPVSGGERPARDGTVAMYAAGWREEEDGALLADLSDSIVTLPRHGDPALVKLVNNTLAAYNAANAARCLEFVTSQGVAGEDFLRALGRGSGRSHASAILHLLSRNQLELLEKDVRLLREDHPQAPRPAEPAELADLVASALGEIADPAAVV